MKRIFAVIIFVFLIAMPTAKHIALIVVWILPLSPRKFSHAYHTARAVGKWAMLDVFTLSMYLFFIWADEIVEVKMMNGLYI